MALDEGEEEQFYKRFLPIADRVFVEQIVPIWKEALRAQIKKFALPTPEILKPALLYE